jgi:hypothetical protein
MQYCLASLKCFSDNCDSYNDSKGNDHNCSRIDDDDGDE